MKANRSRGQRNANGSITIYVSVRDGAGGTISYVVQQREEEPTNEFWARCSTAAGHADEIRRRNVDNRRQNRQLARGLGEGVS